MDRQAIERGFEFERKCADQLSGSLQPGSGNKFYAQGDVVSHGLGISAKSELNLTLSKIRNHLKEAVDLFFQTNQIPVLAIEIAEDGEELVVMRLSDFSKALQEVKIPEYHASKGLEKRERIKTPLLLRET